MTLLLLIAAFEVTDTDGRRVSLSHFRGRPTLIVYEDRHSTELNKAFKERLFQRAEAQNLLGKVNLVAVAYLKPFDFFPARGFALSHVRGLEEKLGIPIYVDFKGALAQPPLSLPTNTSTIVLLDRAGDVLFRHSGALARTPAEVRLNEVLHEVTQNQ